LDNLLTKISHLVSLFKFLETILEKQIMKAVGEMLNQSAVRKDPTLRAAKEKEGVFSMEKE
jgi:3-methyladenine DNA glycosylase AlkD